MALPLHDPITLSDAELKRYQKAAEQALDAAAAVTTRYFRQHLDVDNKAGDQAFDPVTIADREAELVIRDTLERLTPEIGFYGEEHEPRAEGDLIWVVDPIDGTRAYVSGMPMWGTLIGLYNGRDAVLGLLDQPVLQERFVGRENGAAELKHAGGTRQLATRSTTSLSQSTFYCTTPDMFVDPVERAAFERVRDGAQLVRYGGDCYAYALLAAGFVDVVLDCDLQPYDIVALIPLVQAAGGEVSNWQGESAVDGGTVVATANAQLHQEILALLQS